MSAFLPAPKRVTYLTAPNAVVSKIIRIALLVMISIFLSAGTAKNTFAIQDDSSEDIVITHRSDGAGTVKRRGTISEWKGFAITLTKDGRSREIDNEDIVEIETGWPAEYLEALSLLDGGETKLAVGKLKSAITKEQRDWARRTIRADLVRAYSANENHVAAIQQFLAITKEDPQTRFFHLCPLVWVPTTVRIDRAAKTLIQSRQPVEQLLGASWLLTSSDRVQKDQATKVLEGLSRDIDANIKYLAVGQLWRLRVSVNERQIAFWEKQIGLMPAEIRAGPWYIVAEAQSRANQTESATLNLMRLPILYSDQIRLSAAALYRAGHLLHNTGQTDEAKIVWGELRTNYPQSIWANQVPKTKTTD